jgi:predicted HNH restriction endonuclease
MYDYKIPMQRVMSWQISFLKKVQSGNISAEKTLNDNQKIVVKNGFVTHSVDGVFTISELGIARIAELIEWKKYLRSPGYPGEEAPKWPWSFEKPLANENAADELSGVQDDDYEQLDLLQESAVTLESDAESTEKYVEGASYYVQVTASERNPAARRKCIQHYGLTCTVCNFNFEKMYGAAAKTYIHVHHLTPLASKKEEYVVDPVVDLRPVCANCHAVIHLNQPPYTIEEVKAMLAKSAR